MGKMIDNAHVMLELGLSASSTDEEEAIVQQAVVKAEGAVMRFLHYDPVQRSRTEYYPQKDVRVHGGTTIWEAEGTHAYTRREARSMSEELQLRHIPVRATPAIDLRIDYDGRFGTGASSFAASSQKTEGTDFWPDYDGNDSDGNAFSSDGILRSIGLWPDTPGSVRIVYTAGYSFDELQGQDSILDASPITTVIIEEALRRAKRVLAYWKKSSRIGHTPAVLTGEKLGDYSWTGSGGGTSSSGGGGAPPLFSNMGLTNESKDMLSPFVHYGIMV